MTKTARKISNAKNATNAKKSSGNALKQAIKAEEKTVPSIKQIREQATAIVKRLEQDSDSLPAFLEYYKPKLSRYEVTYLTGALAETLSRAKGLKEMVINAGAMKSPLEYLEKMKALPTFEHLVKETLGHKSKTLEDLAYVVKSGFDCDRGNIAEAAYIMLSRRGNYDYMPYPFEGLMIVLKEHLLANPLQAEQIKFKMKGMHSEKDPLKMLEDLREFFQNLQSERLSAELDIVAVENGYDLDYDKISGIARSATVEAGATRYRWELIDKVYPED